MFDVPVSATVMVCDAAHEPPLAVVDSFRRAAMAAAVTAPEVTAPEVTVAARGQVTVEARLTSVSVRTAFDVSVRTASGGPDLTSDGGEAGPVRVPAGGSDKIIVEVRGTLGPADRADVTFRPCLDGLRAGTDAMPIWGEPVVVHDVPVTRIAR